MIAPEYLEHLVGQILHHTLQDRPAVASVLLDVVSDNGDSADLYGVCCAVADTGRVAMQALYPLAGSDPEWQLPPDAVDRLVGDPHRLFAVRFQTAYLNRDHAMTTALFQAAEAAGPEDRTESICALLAHVRVLTLRAEQGPATPDSGGVPA
ncbi:hypothetical protein [Streptomyces sp. KAU_LT]|uniref:hypothetical protein n=1 Tax=Streptomyces sp. KAU_LT TaxID=3046669 RepID=UPI0024B69063|nr:hypothetical protein [Streptomyces sp. KAU_LT]MDI9836220.1 hypothetical protein [Streptomyces sp. KAU_LT]